MGVVWKNLTVTGSAGISLTIRTFPEVVMQTFLWAPLALAMKFGAFNPGTRKLLDNFSGEYTIGFDPIVYLGSQPSVELYIDIRGPSSSSDVPPLSSPSSPSCNVFSKVAPSLVKWFSSLDVQEVG